MPVPVVPTARGPEGAMPLATAMTGMKEPVTTGRGAAEPAAASE